MSTEDNKRVVENFVEVCQNQHDLAAADDIFRIKDGQLVEHWTSMDLGALRSQMQPSG